MRLSFWFIISGLCFALACGSNGPSFGTAGPSGAGGSSEGGSQGGSAGGMAGGDSCPGADNPRGWISDTEVAISPGIVRGDIVTGLGPHEVTRFRGIPFAESTAGDNRFRAPVAKQCLVTEASEVFDALTWPAICRQNDRDGVPTGSEDCLGLNIWAPTGSAAGEDRPVLVWLHGGGMWYGDAQSNWVPGPHLSSDGVVSVSVHSRVGPLGYVAHPIFQDESPTGSAAGNYGIMDVIESLRWVRDNIDAFGGDPNNVTVLGLSGGADRVYYLLASPEAAGLFHRAAPHAGSTWVVQEPTRIERTADTMAAYVGCGDVEGEALRDCLRAAPAEAFDDFNWFAEESFMYANVDGYILPDSLENVFESGAYNKVPVISLSDAHDRATATPDNIVDILGSEEADWFAFIDANYGSYAEDIKAAYPFASFENTHLAQLNSTMWAAYEAMETDWLFNCAHRRLADRLADGQSEPVFNARFSDCPDNGSLPSTCTIGSFHGSDLILLFRAQWSNEDEFALANTMVSYWTSFMSSGDANHAGATSWLPYDSDSRNVMIFDSDAAGVDDDDLGPGAIVAMSDDNDNARCDLWDRIWDERGMVASHYHDLDGDGTIDRADNCLTVANPSQADSDNDAIGDACD
jgi:para-nitrobenzyl esterase